MRLTFRRALGPIRGLNDVTLPDFTLVSGLNGSGKSRLLEAIRQSAVQIDGGEAPVRSFTQENILPHWRVPRDADFRRVMREVKANQTLLQRRVRVAVEKVAECPHDTGGLTTPEIEDLYATESIKSAIVQAISSEQHAFLRVVDPASGSNPSQATYRVIKKIGPEDFRTSTFNDLVLHVNDDFVGFDAQIGAVIALYRELRREAQDRTLEERNFHILDDFDQRYGSSPWHLLNSVFADVGLPYEIDISAGVSENDEILLRNLTTNHVVRNTELSTGERVIAAMAAFQLRTWMTIGDRRVRPVVLFDEIDAPLHPSMAKTYLDMIQRVLIDTFRFRVIAVTHSPSTVAQAPEESIYILRNEDQHHLQKATKDEALRLLTRGVPTLSIDFSGRRQVFVESEHDREAYTAIYEHLRLREDHTRSLEFVAVGHATGGGKDSLIRLVTELAKNGNRSILGLLDWDGGAHADKVGHRLHFAALGRYTIENLLYDPLLLLGAIQLGAKGQLTKVGLDQSTSVSKLKSMPVEDLQKAIDEIQIAILGPNLGEKVPVQYEGGFVLDVARTFLEHSKDDGKFGAKVITPFAPLIGAARASVGHRPVYCHIAKTVLVEYPEFLPTVIRESFERLLAQEL